MQHKLRIIWVLKEAKYYWTTICRTNCLYTIDGNLKSNAHKSFDFVYRPTSFTLSQTFDCLVCQSQQTGEQPRIDKLLYFLSLCKSAQRRNWNLTEKACIISERQNYKNCCSLIRKKNWTCKHTMYQFIKKIGYCTTIHHNHPF